MKHFSLDDIKNSPCAHLNEHLLGEISKKGQTIFKNGNKVSKYRNKKVVVDGIEFDSKKEANRYFYLKKKKLEGKIYNLFLQVPFELSVCTYIADFTYQLSSTDELIVEDVKSAATRKIASYRLKVKLMKAEKGIDIIEI